MQKEKAIAIQLSIICGYVHATMSQLSNDDRDGLANILTIWILTEKFADLRKDSTVELNPINLSNAMIR